MIRPAARDAWVLATTLVVAAACGARMSVKPQVAPSLTSAKCPTGRIATVNNPTSAAVNVFTYLVDTGGRTKIGTVDADSERDFELSENHDGSLRFEWVEAAETHASNELKQVKYKIHCQT